MPSYAAWWRGSDMTAGYRLPPARCSRCCRAAACAGRWTLKSPGHALALDALTAVYPDARLVRAAPRPGRADRLGVQPHPHDVLGTFSDVDHRDYIRDHWTRTLEDCIAGGSTPTRTGCSTCSTPTWSPTRSARWPRLYDALGLDATPGAFDAMSALVAERPQGSLGVHRYDLASYGLVEDELRERFAGYVDRYDVPREMGTG